MGRVSKGGYRFKCRRGIYGIAYVEANGSPREVSLCTRDIEEARRLAPVVYAERVLGVAKDSDSNFSAGATTSFVELFAEWLVAILSELGRDTNKTYLIYGRHWKKHFSVLGDVRPATIGNYQRARLKEVIRDTVELELSAMRRFFRWLKEQEYIRAVPDFPVLGKKVTGTRKPGRRTKPTMVLSPEQMDTVIEAMPVWSEKKRKGKHFAIRPWFEVARETGLRPITIDNLVGRDVTVSGLHVRDENDKNKWGRVVPLTPRAKAAIDLVKSDDPDALLFGRHEWNYFFHKAALETLGPEIAQRVSKYDLKHGLVTELFDSGASETGIQFLTGTVSAIRRYSHPTRSAAEEANRARFGGHSGDMATRGQRGQQKTRQIASQSAKSYMKPKSKNPGKTEPLVSKKAR